MARIGPNGFEWLSPTSPPFQPCRQVICGRLAGQSVRLLFFAPGLGMDHHLWKACLRVGALCLCVLALFPEGVGCVLDLWGAGDRLVGSGEVCGGTTPPSSPPSFSLRPPSFSSPPSSLRPPNHCARSALTKRNAWENLRRFGRCVPYGLACQAGFGRWFWRARVAAVPCGLGPSGWLWAFLLGVVFLGASARVCFFREVGF